MARSEKDYGLPRLTIAEAARVLGIREGELWIWLNEIVRPGESQSSRWRNDVVPLPEALIRLYLARKIEAETSYHDRMQQLREQQAEQERREAARLKREAAQAAKKPPQKRRAAG